MAILFCSALVSLSIKVRLGQSTPAPLCHMHKSLYIYIYTYRYVYIQYTYRALGCHRGESELLSGLKLTVQKLLKRIHTTTQAEKKL